MYSTNILSNISWSAEPRSRCTAITDFPVAHAEGPRAWIQGIRWTGSAFHSGQRTWVGSLSYAEAFTIGSYQIPARADGNVRGSAFRYLGLSIPEIRNSIREKKAKSVNDPEVEWSATYTCRCSYTSILAASPRWYKQTGALGYKQLNRGILKINRG